MMKEGILQIVEVISNEKGIDREDVFNAIEEAIALATRKKLHYTRDDFIQVVMDRDDASYKTYLLEAKNMQDLLPEDLNKPELSVLDLAEEQIQRTELENITFDRVCIQMAKQIVYQKIREAESSRIFNNMKARIGDFIKGTVKYARNNGYVIQDYDDVHYFLPMSELLNDEYFRPNDKVQAVLHDVSIERNRNRFTLSRRADALLEQLMYIEIPEISEGSIQIKGIVRNPGVRAKVIVKSNDKRIDCVGACIGIRGMRAQVISNVLNGERVGVIEWHEDVAQLVLNVLAPVEAESIMINEDGRKIFVAVAEESYAQAIGKDGQNVQMASKLLGWNICIMSPEELSKKKTEKNQEEINKLAEQLSVSKEIAGKFFEAGYVSLEDVSYIEDADEVKNLSKTISDVSAIISNAQEALLLVALQQYDQE